MATKREELGSAELLRKLRLAISNQAEEVPEGWKTAAQWSQEWNVTHNAAGIVLGKSTKLGLMECRKFRPAIKRDPRAISAPAIAILHPPPQPPTRVLRNPVGGFRKTAAAAGGVSPPERRGVCGF